MKYLKLSFLLRLLVAIILLQTLFFKFTGAQESIDLFTKIAGKHEAFMRIGTGVLELIATILLFIRNKTWLGAILVLGLMAGAIFSHLTIIGISFNHDKGLLFGSAVVALIASLLILFLHKKEVPFIQKKTL